ncbi:E3 ubiquitin-protein ligase RNF4 isoform X1 [Choloepus didactylus]|uniref:E3 ubiquitin-protein ligase RNF4 isoform X1 n=1 Tax=Choloepus didactylus TaxID=27675 RepID=UPI00189EFA1E|nr:E3 ubiquitin-protein ligase RNF4 isoform X1 [Choloepus didactylus]XP_037685202.1 E3 ubiquitin-protein ligase RNF4 isoform X1 [Choloepus didactylus]XP_037685203.1 E3 ubiquitin-protein ligase RNF4 isoform X1 [Choloepus didactylus]XP_037685204.1 E3 ubiquitin-protein ligase RNF4 isoform X1 [Choloepus didactylus]
MSTRKRRGGTIHSRQAQKRTREAASIPEMALEAEPIELVESAGDEIVDLTCESLEPVVVDLTHNDSVVIVDDRRRPRRDGRRLRQDRADSCVVSSDDEELSRDRDVYVTTHTSRSAREEGATGLRLCRTGVSSFPQNVAMSSVASASVIPLRMPILAQLVGKRSTTNVTTPFIYELYRAAQDRQWTDRQHGCILPTVLSGICGYLPPIS